MIGKRHVGDKDKQNTKNTKNTKKTKDKLEAVSKHNNGAMDAFKWFFIAVIIAVGVVGNNYYSGVSLLYRVLALVGLGFIAVIFAFSTAKGAIFFNLLKESKQEAKKIVWPTAREATQTTMVVVIVVLIMGAIMWGLDSVLGWLVSRLI